jgi:transcriptional regulator with PAS, ATPase and Fis domain
VPQPQQAFDSVARIDARDVPRLEDLMNAIVEEIAAVAEVDLARERELLALRGELGGRFRFADIVGKSAPMQRLYQLLDKVVESHVTVLLTGENGTGKELIARALHHNGPRRARAFVAQNCGALNDNLLESELFGHVRGAFTGAERDKVGLFKQADGGTFFLDEVADLSPAMQVKVLRVLQEGTFVPVGGTVPQRVDVRIVAATNKDLNELVQRRQFRQDLFYRLHVLNIEAPPLRARLDDLPLLVQHFLEAHAKRMGKPRKKLHPLVLAGFCERSWPGNVRELENEIERLIVLAGDAEVVPAELAQRAPGLPAAAQHERGSAAAGMRLAALLERGEGSEGGGLASAVAQLERELIQGGLFALGGNRSRLASVLGVSRTTLLKKIRDYAIESPGAGRRGAQADEGDA